MRATSAVWCVCWSAMAWQVASQEYQFCVNGTSHEIDLLDDKGIASVDVSLAQAPLFSTNPAINQTLGAFGLYHTALVLSQEYIDCTFASGCQSVRRNWTLEYDYMGGNDLKTVYPKIIGNDLRWENDMGFCLSEGIAYGQEHFTKSFDTVVRLTSAQVRQMFKDVVNPLNSTSADRLQYQLWRVVKGGWFGRSPRETFVRDVTCLDGARWIFHHISSVLGVQIDAHFELKGSAALVDADHVEQVNTTDAEEWTNVVKYYTHVAELMQNVSKAEKILDFIRVVPLKYVYDTNSRIYYRVVGNHFPWARPAYVVDPLGPPPSNLGASSSPQIIV